VKTNILIPLIVAVVMAAAVKVAFGYPYLQAKLSVLFAGGLVLVLALVQLMREIRRKEPPTDKPGADQKEAERGASAMQYGLEATWMAGFGLTIYLLGFIIAIPLFTCAYMKSHGTRWATSIITAVLMVAFCYGIFSLVLDMKLYPGEIFIRLGL